MLRSVALCKSKSDDKVKCLDNNGLSSNINYSEKSVLVYDLSISGLSVFTLNLAFTC